MARLGFAWTALLFLVAFGFRQVYLLESMANPLFGAPQVDAGAYDSWARELAAGQWLVALCRLFPIDERDLRDRDIIAPDTPCGFSFLPLEEDRARPLKAAGDGGSGGPR